MAEGDERFQTAVAWTPTAQRRHVGLDPGLINEHQPPGIDFTLPGFPAQPMTRDISALLFAGEDCFLKLSFSSWAKVQTER
jgi:hypothetical protein